MSMEAASAHSTSGAQRREQGGRRPQAEQPTSSRAVLSCPEDTQSELGDVETGRGGSAAIAVHTPAAAVKATSGRAKRKERRLRNEPQNVTGEERQETEISYRVACMNLATPSLYISELG